MSQGSECLRSMAGADGGTVFPEALIPEVVSDVLNGPVPTTGRFDLMQSDAVTAETSDEILDGDRGFAAVLRNPAGTPGSLCDAGEDRYELKAVVIATVTTSMRPCP